MKFRTSRVTAIVLLMGVGAAGADPILFTGNDSGVAMGGASPNSDAARDSFAAAAGLLDLITFEDVALRTTGGALDANTSFVMSEMPFPGVFVSNFQALGSNTTAGGSQYLQIRPNILAAVASVTFDFVSPLSAFGAYLTGTEALLSGEISMIFDDGVVRTIDVTKNAVAGIQFIGFTNEAAFSSVTFQLTGPFESGFTDVWGIDDIGYALHTVTSVPEPSVLSLLIVGLFGAGLAGKKRLAAAVAP